MFPTDIGGGAKLNCYGSGRKTQQGACSVPEAVAIGVVDTDG